MNTKELTTLVEEQGARIEALEARLEKALEWATKAQAHILALEGKAAPKKETEWKSGPRPSHPVRRPQAPAAAAAEPEMPEPLDDSICNPSPVVPEDCPF